ncbi:hypothetical protein CCM_03779 [Cordyceps militaris CM01]|uniref:Uncharacterized protein n=1 Tax=Cordyceps militaris (strain CM01) TaxID=983644 RepID=G3JGI9_CORMM|nr:uncharacterized protein CCM_03779 [Cordyceps militaris CM01]EGX92406.1 hypothetical protein CCM_03779 [Cordyceps militaris CM01]
MQGLFDAVWEETCLDPTKSDNMNHLCLLPLDRTSSAHFQCIMLFVLRSAEWRGSSAMETQHWARDSWG